MSIASSKLEYQFENDAMLNQFKLVDGRFESNKSWVFRYEAGSCVIDIIIDKCGVSDVGGLSAGCIRENSI